MDLPREEAGEEAEQALPGGIAGGLLAIAAHDREAALARGYGWTNTSCCRYVRWLVRQGYEPTAIEQELLDQDPGDGQADG